MPLQPIGNLLDTVASRGFLVNRAVQLFAKHYLVLRCHHRLQPAHVAYAVSATVTQQYLCMNLQNALKRKIQHYRLARLMKALFVAIQEVARFFGYIITLCCGNFFANCHF